MTEEYEVAEELKEVAEEKSSEELKTENGGAVPSSFELKFIECAHIVTVPLRVHPDPHAPKARPAAPARYDTRDFFSRPVRVPGVCPTCHRAKPTAKAEAKPVTKAAAAGASISADQIAAATDSVATVVQDFEPTPPP